MLGVLKCLWIVLSYFDVPHERYHRLHGLTSCRFYVGLLARVCFASCEYYAAANICLNVNIFQFYRDYLRFRRLVVEFGVWMVLAFKLVGCLTVRKTLTASKGCGICMTFGCHDAIYPFRRLGFLHTIHPSAGKRLFLKHLEYVV